MGVLRGALLVVFYVYGLRCNGFGFWVDGWGRGGLQLLDVVGVLIVC